MKLEATTQWSNRPTGAPNVVNPVKATLDCPVYYYGENGPVPSFSPVYCAGTFARTVLAAIEEWCVKHHFALVHVGIYNPRPARKANGQEITPKRWSNHAYGCAIDFKGIKVNHGKGGFLSVDILQADAPAKWRELLDAVSDAMKAANLKPEMVDEGGWYHMGYFPR